MDPTESVDYNSFGTSICNSQVEDHGWTKVVSRRRNKKQRRADGGASGKIIPRGTHILTPKMVSADVEDASNGAGAARLKRLPNSFGDENAASSENLKANENQKSIASLSEAAAKIDNTRLAALLSESLESYAAQPEIQLERFVDYLAIQLSGVQFPWLTVFPSKGPWPKLIDVIDVPLCDIPEPIYKTTEDWITQLPVFTLSGFVLYAFGFTLTHLAVRRGALYRMLAAEPIQGVSGMIGGEQLNSPRPQLALLVLLAMVLRTLPNALTYALGNLRDMHSVQGRDKLLLTVWMMAQSPQAGGLCVGLHSWAMNLLPLVGKNCRPRSRDLILQLVEKILSAPNARTLLMNRAVGKGRRVIPPPSFEILLRLTFPASSARVKDTERFEAIYPLLKEVALAGAPGSEAMKEVIQQIFTISMKLAGEGNPELAKEAREIAVWCVTENVDCCKQWESLYKENLEASVAVLKKIVDEWKDHSVKLSSSTKNTLTLSRAVKSFRLQNEKAIAESGANNFLHKKAEEAISKRKAENAISRRKANDSLYKEAEKANDSLYKEAEKSCKVILGRLFRGSCKSYCLKATTITAVVLAVAGAAVLSSNLEATTELKSLVDLYINSVHSF